MPVLLQGSHAAVSGQRESEQSGRHRDCAHQQQRKRGQLAAAAAGRGQQPAVVARVSGGAREREAAQQVRADAVPHAARQPAHRHAPAVDQPPRRRRQRFILSLFLACPRLASIACRKFGLVSRYMYMYCTFPHLHVFDSFNFYSFCILYRYDEFVLHSS